MAADVTAVFYPEVAWLNEQQERVDADAPLPLDDQTALVEFAREVLAPHVRIVGAQRSWCEADGCEWPCPTYAAAARNLPRIEENL